MTSMKRLFRLLLLTLLPALSLAAERTQYFVNDALGSPVAAMDEQGVVLWRESYKPWGERATRPATNPARPAYTGKPEDAESGLVYMGARMYDPEAGRFTGIDPVGFSEQNVQSWGRYLYANNSPYRYLDPDGETPLDIVFLAADAVSFASAAYSGDRHAMLEAGADIASSVIGVLSPIPAAGQMIKAAKTAEKVSKSGNLVIGRGKDLAKQGALSPSEYKLGWPSKLPDWKAEWKENAGRLRAVMREGRPIRDASPGDNAGPFLNAERNLLRDRGWSFDSKTNYWNPPSAP